MSIILTHVVVTTFVAVLIVVVGVVVVVVLIARLGPRLRLRPCLRRSLLWQFMCAMNRGGTTFLARRAFFQWFSLASIIVILLLMLVIIDICQYCRRHRSRRSICFSSSPREAKTTSHT